MTLTMKVILANVLISYSREGAVFLDCVKNDLINIFLKGNATDCKLVFGELKSTGEHYLETTETAQECVQEAKARALDADGITFTLNTKECWAKYGSSNSTDPNGCSFCQSCVLGK